MLKHPYRNLLVLAALLIAPLFGALPPARAQGPCGVVDSIDPPLDPARFSVVYPYGRPSSRYDGRYHTGEDWFGSRTATYGEPVRAIARGRVTYAAPLGWGRDKGVVILEHLMPDGTWWYSMYGHMEEVGGYTFPTVYTCVNKGDIIGAIGRPRPAPHLHLEIRNFGSDSPGPGYWSTDPTYSGWRNPSQFIQNWQAWLNPAYAWHADIADESGPHYPAIIRADNATVVFDDGRLKALNPAGQVLWRYIIPEGMDVVGVLPYQDQILVADSGGIMETWSLDGGFLEQWQLPYDGIDAVYIWDNLLIVHAGDALIAYGPDRLEQWRVPDVPRPVEARSTHRVLGVMSTGGALTLVGIDGRIYDRATLRGTGSLAPAPDGGLYVRSRYSLWHVDPEGTWHRLADVPPVQRAANALFSLPDGRFFVNTGTAMMAYDATGQLLWQTPLPDIQGNAILFHDGGALVVASGDGHVAVLDAASGAVCNQIAVWGNRSAAAWAGLGTDGILRLHIADQVLGLSWAVFSAGCG